MESANQNYRVTAANMLVAELVAAAADIGEMKPHRRRILVARGAAAIETYRGMLAVDDQPISRPTGIVGDLEMLQRESTTLPDVLAAQVMRQMADEIRRLAELVKRGIWLN